MLSREWRCSWSSADRRCSNYIWVIDNLIAYMGASYIRGFTVNGNGGEYFLIEGVIWTWKSLGAYEMVSIKTGKPACLLKQPNQAKIRSLQQRKYARNCLSWCISAKYDLQKSLFTCVYLQNKYKLCNLYMSSLRHRHKKWEQQHNFDRLRVRHELFNII